ncbi:hypothetical protein H2201_003349 [Coniosporium apollinis]|uniref:Cytochrome c oxidase assembly factor 6 n=2 Tax=Coniosporium TaxID=2810619 RepID=A0ABQ9P206_9PEZI|nr:hypothetical protein H2199_002210 [Cladosporium sp. JES 115]KAJ9666427.1 hypothetical protein H2201_003349 [Coniosporium apollinis]
MGWFSSEPQAPAAPQVSSDGAFIAPDRNSRAACWESRDAFFQCLDRHNILDAVKDKQLADQHCGKEDVKFGKNCASSWVQYFKKRRVVEFKKDQTLKQLQAEGAKPLPEGVALPGPGSGAR